MVSIHLFELNKTWAKPRIRETLVAAIASFEMTKLCAILMPTPKLDLVETPDLSNSKIETNTYEPSRDKTNKVSVRPAKTQISLGIRPV